jgi:hypothetical protein
MREIRKMQANQATYHKKRAGLHNLPFYAPQAPVIDDQVSVGRCHGPQQGDTRPRC